MERNSFIVTGASASGKTTLITEAIKSGYIYLPTHMTRPIRPGEKNGESAIFIPKSEFKENFNNGLYIEESLDFALLKSIGEYYGTPREWLVELQKLNRCASPVSIAIAKEIYKALRVLWIHLYCNDEDRYKRLVARGISEEEVDKRMKSGDSINFPDEATMINTSVELPSKILEKIKMMERE